MSSFSIEAILGKQRECEPGIRTESNFARFDDETNSSVGEHFLFLLIHVLKQQSDKRLIRGFCLFFRVFQTKVGNEQRRGKQRRKHKHNFC